eukprot:1161979-Pelagomonas_calceolata.AAC.15
MHVYSTLPAVQFMLHTRMQTGGKHRLSIARTPAESTLGAAPAATASKSATATAAAGKLPVPTAPAAASTA